MTILHRTTTIAVAFTTLLFLSACEIGASVPDEVANVAPVAAIASPDDETSMDLPVSGVAVDAEDGELSGASLTWSWRVVGDADWIDGPTGSSGDLSIPLSTITPFADLEIRLVAEDSSGDTDEVIIEITMQGVSS